MGKRQRYSPEFKAEAVRMVFEQDLDREEVARRLSVPSGTLYRWVSNAVSRQEDPPSGSEQDLRNEVNRLRKEVSELRLEREILKKAAAYFAKESLPGTHS